MVGSVPLVASGGCVGRGGGGGWRKRGKKRVNSYRGRVESARPFALRQRYVVAFLSGPLHKVGWVVYRMNKVVF